MTHKYTIIGVTCNGCINTIQEVLTQIPEIKSAVGTLNPPQVVLELNSHIELAEINRILKESCRYQLANEEMIMSSTSQNSNSSDSISEPAPTKLSDFIPLFVIFAYILGGSLLLTYITRASTMANLSMPGMAMMKENLGFQWMPWMNYFMGIWFILFSLFKFFDLKGFATGYSTYDLIAKRWSGWGYIYPFVELGLGVSYLLGIYLFATNIITLVLMLIGVVGVSLKLVKKSKIQCLCLGTILKVPLTQITLYENGAMTIMALIMLFM